MAKKLPEAITKTLIYSDIFDFPLTILEIRRYLIGSASTEPEVSKSLYAHNPNTGKHTQIKINQWQGYFYLDNRKWIVKQRIRREKIAREKLKKATCLTAILKIVPWIKLVAVTGRVAALNSKDNDDIDLLIITAKDRLWLSRLLEWLILTLLRRRRRPNQKQNLKNKLCPNMYLTQDSLQLPHQDLFTANELARLKVVWERGGVYQALVRANQWTRKYLPNWGVEKEKRKMENRKWEVGLKSGGWKVETNSGGNKDKSASQPILYFLPPKIYLLSSILNLCESLARFLQLKYMQRHRTCEVVKNSLLMFHPRDVRVKVLTEYKRKISLLKSSKSSSTA